MDVLDLVFEVSNICAKELPDGVVAFGRHLSKMVAAQKGGFPDLPEDIKDVVKLDHVVFLTSIRGNYMSRLIIYALGRRKIDMNLGKQPSEYMKTLALADASTRIRTLLPKFGKSILKIDSLCDLGDPCLVSSIWGPMINDLLTDGTFDEKPIIDNLTPAAAEAQEGSGKVEGGTAGEGSLNGADSKQPEGHGHHLVDLRRLITFGCVGQDGGNEPAGGVKSSYELASVRMAIQANILTYARLQTPGWAEGSFVALLLSLVPCCLSLDPLLA